MQIERQLEGLCFQQIYEQRVRVECSEEKVETELDLVVEEGVHFLFDSLLCISCILKAQSSHHFLGV